MPTATTLVRVTLSTFDNSGHRPTYRAIRENLAIERFDGVTPVDYTPSGGTPLRDATAEFVGHLSALQIAHPDDVTIGLLLDESGSMGHLRQAVIDGSNEFVNGMRDVKEVDSEAKGKVLAVIFTDGLENASKETSPDALRDLITSKEAEGWTFIYLGANQDAWAAGGSYGFSGSAGGQMANFVATPTGARSAMANVSKRAGSYLSDNEAFVMDYSGEAMGSSSILEDGSETTVNTGADKAKPTGNLWTPGQPVPVEDNVAGNYSAGAKKEVDDATKKASDILGGKRDKDE